MNDRTLHSIYRGDDGHMVTHCGNVLIWIRGEMEKDLFTEHKELATCRLCLDGQTKTGGHANDRKD